MTLWHNGALVDAASVRIDPSDRGFTLGDGVFETIRVVRAEPVRLDRHLARLDAGAASLGIPVPFDEAIIGAACTSVIVAEHVIEGSLRITLSRGPATRGLAPPIRPNPTLLISAYTGSPRSDAVTLITARSTRRNEYSPLSRIKSLNYLDGILARREAEAVGADDALMLNTAGLVAESTIATVIMFQEDRFWTPPLQDGALPGIARQVLLEAGIIAERSIDPSALDQASALFLCNSLGVRQVSKLDGHYFTERPELLDRLRTALEPSRP